MSIKTKKNQNKTNGRTRETQQRGESWPCACAGIFQMFHAEKGKIAKINEKQRN